MREGMLKMILLSEALHLLLPLLVSALASKHSNEQALHGHSWLLNFDGIHYFQNQYLFEQNHAFLPFFVGAVNIAKGILGDHAALLMFVLLNRCFFVMAAFEIQRILSLIGKEKKERAVEVGTIAFLFNPASIFYHVLYTESLFCLLTCKAIRLSLEGKGQWKSAILLSFGVSLRTNGLFLSPVIGLQIMDKFITSIKHKKISETLKYLAKGCTMLFIILLPFISHLVFSYRNICSQSNDPPAVCSNKLPNIYSYVQEKYWNVGLFNYFQLSNALFIAIGSPAILLSVLGVLTRYNSRWNLREKGLFLSFLVLLVMTVCFTNVQSSTRFFSTHPLFYYILAAFALKWKIVRFWIVFYCLAGVFLYTVAFPWT